MGYVTVQDMRDEGLLSPTDDAIQSAIDLWSDAIDRATSQFFESRTETYEIFGEDSKLLLLPISPLTIQLYLNESDSPEDSDNYYLFNNREHPHVILKEKIFYKSKLQRLIGTWGVLENDDTPLLIKRAVKKLVIENIVPMADVDDLKLSGKVKSIKVDNYSVSFDTGSAEISLTDLIFRDPEVSAIIDMYRAPTSLRLGNNEALQCTD